MNVCYIDLDGNQFADDIIEFLSERLNDVRVLVGHNIKFDLKVLKKYNIRPRSCELFCTMVADHLIDEERRHGLKELMSTIFGYEVRNYSSVKKKTREFYEYALNDAQWTWELMELHKGQLQQQGLMDVFRTIEMPFQNVLVEIETNGMHVDLKTMNETKTQLVYAEDSIRRDMLGYLKEKFTVQMDLTGTKKTVSRVNFNSIPQLLGIFSKLGIPINDVTEKGNQSIGKKTLEKNKDHPFVAMLIKYRIICKLLSAFFTPLPEMVDEDGVVRSSYNDCGTVTGRLSCSEPNLQQLPKVNKQFPVDTRKCFVAPQGYKMISADYSSQELRVLAAVSSEEYLIDVFRKGKDLHLTTANDFFSLGIPEECLYESHPQFDEYKHRFKSERDKAKIVNFGMAYGKGAFGFRQDFEITEEEAQTILDRYFATLPGVKRAIEDCKGHVRAEGFVASLTGRRRRFTPITKDGQTFYTKKQFREAFNFLIQGFSADMIRIAAIDCMTLKVTRPHWNLSIVGTVHDEILFTVKAEYAEEAAAAIKKAFEDAVNIGVPISAGVNIGDNYGDCK